MRPLFDDSSQIPDDPARFECLVAAARSPDLDDRFTPTRYWIPYQLAIEDEIRRWGLKDIRRRKPTALDKFVSVEEPPFSPPPNVSGPKSMALRLISWLSGRFFKLGISMLPYGHTLDSINLLAFRVAELYGQVCGAAPLSLLEDYCVGNPDHVFHVGDCRYTHTFLYFYCRYATCASHVDFANLKSFVELGGGMGMQAEIIKRAHPHLKIYVYDLATQTYYQHQYLSAIFGPAETCAGGTIRCLPNWEIASAQWERPLLFWNAASFGEMEPEIVEVYLNKVLHRTDHVYLFQAMGGKELSQDGGHGVSRQTRFDDYARMLGTEFQLSGRRPYFPGVSRYYRSLAGYEEAIWQRRAATGAP